MLPQTIRGQPHTFWLSASEHPDLVVTLGTTCGHPSASNEQYYGWVSRGFCGKTGLCHQLLEQLSTQAASTSLILYEEVDSRTLDGCEADERADGPLGPAALRRWGPGKWGPSRPNSVAARSGAMPVPHAELGQPHNQDGLESDCGVQQTESVEFAEADLHSIPFSHNKGGEMQVSSVLHHLVAVSTELQLGAVFTSHQSLQMGTTKTFLSVQSEISHY